MEDNKKPLFIEPDPDDNISLSQQQEFISQENERVKNQFFSEFGMYGEKYLTEKDRKKIKQNKEKEKYYKYISKHSIEYSYDEIMSYDIYDVRKIYNDLKSQNQSFITKFFRFIFNI